MPDGEFYVSIRIALARHFRAIGSKISVSIPVNIDELKTSEVNAVRTRRPDRIEKIRIEDL